MYLSNKNKADGAINGMKGNHFGNRISPLLQIVLGFSSYHHQEEEVDRVKVNLAHPISLLLWDRIPVTR